MKKFIKHIFLLLAALLFLMFVCDFGYSKIYRDCHPRNKLQYLLKAKQQHLDVVFVGNSRVANHIDPLLFSQLSHKKSINMGVPGAELNDNLLQLQLLLDRNKVKIVYLQIDSNLEATKPSMISTAEAMPFLDNPFIAAHTQRYSDEFAALYYIPFYRYAVNDAEIGFRELFFSLLNKKPATDPTIGFTPKFGNKIPQKIPLIMEEKTALQSNPLLEDIKILCKAKNTKLVLFMAPYCSKLNTKPYVLKIKKWYPDLVDLTQGFNDSLFYNCGHLNDKGAEVLTKRLYETTKETLQQ